MAATETVSIEIEIGGESKTLNFKPLNQVPLGLVRAHRGNGTELTWASLEWALSAEDLALFDKLPSRVFQDTWDRMQKASKVDMGESSAS